MTARNTRMTAVKKCLVLKWLKTVSKTANLILLFLVLTPCAFAQIPRDTTDKRFHDQKAVGTLVMMVVLQVDLNDRSGSKTIFSP
jgi:hypothetical protein